MVIFQAKNIKPSHSRVKLPKNFTVNLHAEINYCFWFLVERVVKTLEFVNLITARQLYQSLNEVLSLYSENIFDFWVCRTRLKFKWLTV